MLHLYLHHICIYVGRIALSVQRLATGWTVWGSSPGGGEIFRIRPDLPWGPPSLLYNGYRVFPGGKERPGRDADPSPPSSAVVKKEQNYTYTPPMGRTTCTEPQCLYKGALYLYLLYVFMALFIKQLPKSINSYIYILRVSPPPPQSKILRV